MNLFKLKDFTQGCLRYFYKPEGAGEWGEVAYDFQLNEAKITTRASSSSPSHDRHALSKIKECAEKSYFDREFVQAWV